MLAKPWTICIALCGIACGLVVVRDLHAQTWTDNSHRKLPLPAETQFDQQLQMRMLQHLSGMLKREDGLPPQLREQSDELGGLSSLIKDLNPQQLEALGEAMRALATGADPDDPTLESVKRMLSEIAPDAVPSPSGRESDSKPETETPRTESAQAAEQRIKQLLEQFSRDRRLPLADRSNQQNLPLPGMQGLDPPQRGTRDDAANRPREMQADRRPERQSGDLPDAGPDGAGTVRPRRPGSLGNGNDINGGPSPSRTRGGNSSIRPVNPLRPADENESIRKVPAGTGANNADPRLANGSKVDGAEAESLQRVLEAIRANRGAGGGEAAEEEGLVNKFLEQVAKNPSTLPPFSLEPTGPRMGIDGLPRALEGLKRAGTRESQSSLPQRSASPDTPTSGGITPDQLAQQLDRRGLSKTLGDLFKQARQEVNETERSEKVVASSQNRGEGASLAGLESRLLSGLDGVKDGWLKSMRQANGSKSSSTNGSNKATASNNQNSSSASKTTGDSGVAKKAGGNSAKEAGKSQNSFSKAASAWFKKLTESPSVASATPQASSGDVLPQLPATGSSWPVVGLLLLVTAVAAAVWWWRQHAAPVADRRSLNLAYLAGTNVRNAEDVIRAFHLLADQFAAEHWWTHRRAATELAEEMARTKPEANAALQTLANLYERARYSPAATPLSDEDMMTARRAIEQCIA